MTAFSTAKSGYCMNSAAACTSAHICNIIMDTAILAVSILLVPIICALRT